jgi:hypothetical protein
MGALQRCKSLRLFAVPARLEMIPPTLFRGCQSLTQLVFEEPSRLRSLAVPPSDFGVMRIPDSVENVVSLIPRIGRQSRLIQFGRESSVDVINLNWGVHLLRESDRPDPGNDIFVSLSEEVLRRFRCRFEVF